MLSRSETPGPSGTFFVGVGAGGAALRALASEAAVGANSPDAGVFGLEGVTVCAVAVAVEAEGVFGRAGVLAGVLDRAGVVGARGAVPVREDGRGFACACAGVLLCVDGVDVEVDGAW